MIVVVVLLCAFVFGDYVCLLFLLVLFSCLHVSVFVVFVFFVCLSCVWLFHVCVVLLVLFGWLSSPLLSMCVVVVFFVCFCIL